VVVYAGVRDPANSPTLQTLAASLPQGKVHITKWAAADKQTNDAVADLIRERHGYVDIVIANAGECPFLKFVAYNLNRLMCLIGVAKSTNTLTSETPIDDFKEMLEVCTKLPLSWICI